MYSYAVGLRLTMLQIYLYQYWTVAETQKKGRSAPRPCVDLIIINYVFKKIPMKENKYPLSDFLAKCLTYQLGQL